MPEYGILCTMDLRILRYFLAVAEEGNITRASERLHVSQPALSTQLAALEDELGQKLFERGARGIELTEKGIALYDTATSVRRLKDNASDKFLEVVEPTDIRLLLKQLPQCQAIVTTGQKATDIIRSQIEGVEEPKVGESTPFMFEDRHLRLYRMPSSSRAYPLSIEKKASVYRLMLSELGILQE